MTNGPATAQFPAAIKNHPFNDGNKRAAFAVAAVFLDFNGVELTLSEEEATLAVIGLADGSVTQKQFASTCPACASIDFEVGTLKEEALAAVKCVACDRDYLLLDSEEHWLDVIQRGQALH